MSQSSDSQDPAGVIVPPDALRPETLRGIVEEFVTREGTDYGNAAYSLEEKVSHVMRQLDRGEAQLSFDPVSATISIVSRDRR